MTFRFIDLFAGIGGMRLAAERAGGRCVFSCERNPAAAKTYRDNHGDDPTGDITLVDPSDIPQHDVVLAGFPCQPFSASGLRLGFRDPRGNMFFEVARLAAEAKPACLVLENVAGFAQHDGRRTLGTVLSTLREIGYPAPSWRVLNAVDLGLPQNRARTIIVASRLGGMDWSAVVPRLRVPLSSILSPDVPDSLFVSETALKRIPDGEARTQPKSGLRFVAYMDKPIRRNGVRPGTESLSRVHRQHNRIHCASGAVPTLAAGETSGRYLVALADGRVRRLTLRECHRVQGFPDSFRPHPSSSEAYRQIGNSVPVPMIEAVVRAAAAQGLLGAGAEPAARAA